MFMSKTIRKTISIFAVMLILATFVLAATSYYVTISSNGYRALFSSRTIDTSDTVGIEQISSTDDKGVRYVLQRTSNGVAMDSDYLYGADYTSLYATFDNVDSRLRAYNDYSSSITVDGEWEVF